MAEPARDGPLTATTWRRPQRRRRYSGDRRDWDRARNDHRDWNRNDDGAGALAAGPLPARLPQPAACIYAATTAPDRLLRVQLGLRRPPAAWLVRSDYLLYDWWSYGLPYPPRATTSRPPALITARPESPAVRQYTGARRPGVILRLRDQGRTPLLQWEGKTLATGGAAASRFERKAGDGVAVRRRGGQLWREVRFELLSGATAFADQERRLVFRAVRRRGRRRSGSRCGGRSRRSRFRAR